MPIHSDNQPTHPNLKNSGILVEEEHEEAGAEEIVNITLSDQELDAVWALGKGYLEESRRLGYVTHVLLPNRDGWVPVEQHPWRRVRERGRRDKARAEAHPEKNPWKRR